MSQAHTGVPDDRETMTLSDVDDSVWRFDVGFLQSGWRCTWGCGCQGILDEPAPELSHGCCSVGAELLDDEEAMTIAALAATLDPSGWQYAASLGGEGIFSDSTRRHTRVVDGACVFLNRPDFPGGAGCALHLAALTGGDSPIDVKPSVCWQLPLKVERSVDADGRQVAELRRWRRSDWGPGGATMAWMCTEAAENYDAPTAVVDRLAEELTALLGEPVYLEIRRRLSPDTT